MNKVEVNSNQAALVMLLKEFIESYAQHHDSMPLTDWLAMELKAHMPDKSEADISVITTGIISSLELTKAKRESLDRAISRGRTKDDWFAKEVRASHSEDSVQAIHDSAVNAQEDILSRADVINAEFVESAQTYATPQEAAREVQNAAVLGSIISAEGYDVASQFLGESDSPHSKFIEDTLETGDDTGLKAASAGALKTGSERGLIPATPPGTDNKVLADVGYMAVENVKNAAQRLPFVEVIEEYERNSLAVTAGTLTSTKGVAIGTAIGSVFGPVGAAVGGVIGGVTGFIAGAEITHAVVKKVQDIRKNVLDTITSYIAPVFNRAVEGVKNVGRKLKNTGRKIIDWLFG